MITVQLLEETDIIDPNDWCRPLAIISMSGGHNDYYSFRNQYTGTPENNAKWVRVKDILGPIWFGKTLKEFNGTSYSEPMEFVRGDIPKTHQLNMKGYNSIAHMVTSY